MTCTPARGKQYCHSYYSKRRQTRSYLDSNNDGLVGPESFLGSHFDHGRADHGPRRQEALLVNMHNGNLLWPVQDTVGQRGSAIPWENETHPCSQTTAARWPRGGAWGSGVLLLKERKQHNAGLTTHRAAMHSLSAHWPPMGNLIWKTKGSQ